MERFLIVNADDFGLSLGVNEGIVRAHDEGILTSASLMVWGPAAKHAAQSAREIDLGLHVDLGEWIHREGQWVSRYQRVSPDDSHAAKREIEKQLAEFQRLTGMQPSHLDSHQHVHGSEPVQTICRRLAERLGIPLRGASDRVRYCGSFYGQSGKGDPCPDAISVASLIRLLVSLSPGVTEFGCHPGVDPHLDSVYGAERAVELETLCDVHVRDVLEKENITLFSFRDLPGIASTSHADGESVFHESVAADLERS